MGYGEYSVTKKLAIGHRDDGSIKNRHSRGHCLTNP